MTDSSTSNELDTDVNFKEHSLNIKTEEFDDKMLQDARIEVTDSLKFEYDHNKIKTSDADIENNLLSRDNKTKERELVIKTEIKTEDENFSTISCSSNNEHRCEKFVIKLEPKSECTDTDLDYSFGPLNIAPESNCIVKKENDAAGSFSNCDDSDYKIEIAEQSVKAEHETDGFGISDEDADRKLIHTSELSSFKCQKCKNTLKTKVLLDAHILFKHPENRKLMATITNEIYICNKCTYRTVLKHEFENHLRNHLKTKKLFRCEICNAKYKQKLNLNSHILSKHSENQDLINTVKHKIHKCDKCSYKTVLSYRIKNHLQQHLEPEERKMRFQCKECNLNYTYKPHLDSHILSKHSEDENLMKTVTSKYHNCDKCSYKTVVAYGLKRHLQRHLENEPGTAKSKMPSFQCKICNAKYSRKLNMDIHILSKHSEDQNLIKTVTSKTHKCDKCDYKTLISRSFKLHSETHLGLEERNMPFLCTKCKTKFRDKWQLDGHILAKHSEDKDLLQILTNKIYNCYHCSYKTINRENFKTHLKCHGYGCKKEKRERFHCKTCDKKYTTKAKLDSHILSKHSEDQSLIETIQTRFIIAINVHTGPSLALV